MKVVNRINTADANSQYINNVISSLSESHPMGLTVIQYIGDNGAKPGYRTMEKHNISNMNTVLVTDHFEIYEKLKKEAAADDTVVYGTVEDAKVYIKYSHVLIIDGNLTIQVNSEKLDFSEHKIYLTDIDDNNSLDAKIYKKFLSDNHIDKYIFDSQTIEKLIRETNCIIPSHLIFHHSFTDNFSFRFNI